MNDIKFLLKEISHIAKYHKNIALLSGENFNIFRTLNLASKEVRMHSAFLCEFLNPLGTHGQGDLFLKLFVKQLSIVDFDTVNAEAKVEEPIGTVNDDYTSGGRIDILITDSAGRHIIIENKIAIQEQKNQLLRYHNFDTQAKIFYLTLEGDAPSNTSTGGKDFPVQKISYRSDIINWLDACKKEAVSLPVIRETIDQYINLIKYFTNQTTANKMNDEIKKLILDHPEYLDAIDLCSKALNSILYEADEKFKRLIASTFPGESFPVNEKMSVYVYCHEDSDGVYIGYVLKKGEDNISSSEIAKEYIKILQEIEPSMKNNQFHIGWFNPKPFFRSQKFLGLEKKEFLRMHKNPNYLEDFVKNIKAQETKITMEFLRRIERQ